MLIVKPGFELARLLGRPASEHWEGAPVWRWSAKLGEFGESDDRASTFVALHLPPYVIVSNDPESVLADARALKEASAAVPSGLSEWNDVAPRDYWVYRRFRFDVPHPVAAGLEDIRKDAESLVLFRDRNGTTATVRLVSRDPVANGPESLDDQGRVPPLKPISPRAWETHLSLTAGPDHFDAWFIAFAHLGFGVYL